MVMNEQRGLRAKGSLALKEVKADGVGMWQAGGRIAVGRKETWADPMNPGEDYIFLQFNREPLGSFTQRNSRINQAF